MDRGFKIFVMLLLITFATYGTLVGLLIKREDNLRMKMQQKTKIDSTNNLKLNP